MIVLPHLETNVTLSCQNRCVSCNHFVPLQTKDFKASMMEPATLERDLFFFGRVARTRIWAAIGGEPLLNPKLVELLHVAKRSQAVGVVEVRTNGQALLDMEDDFWRALMGGAMVVTPYPGKLGPMSRGRIAELCEENFVRLEWHEPQFVGLLEPATTPEAAAAKYRSCWFRTFSHVLDHGVFYRCCTTPFIPSLLLGLPKGTDGLVVDETLTGEKLEAFLNQAETPASCAVCCGIATPSSRPINWREIGDPQQWLHASGLTAAEPKG